MAKLLIGCVSPGTSVQDVGRLGWQRYGVAPAGALDSLSLAVANTLVDEPAGAAAIEVGPLTTQIIVLEGSIEFGVAGTHRRITVADRIVPTSSSGFAKFGETITIGPASDGVFTYISFSGGILGTPTLGSMAVHSRAKMGSPLPRPLMSGDLIDVASTSIRSEYASIRLPRISSGPIRIVLGPQEDYFTNETIANFVKTTWQVSPVSDRMAYRLVGPIISHRKSPNIVSDGTVNGSIQVPGNGQPLVLLNDRGTTGGYPKLAVIATADLGRFAQTPIGKDIRFEVISVETAQDAVRSRQAFVRSLGSMVKRISYDDIGTVISENVADSAVNANDFDNLQV